MSKIEVLQPGLFSSIQDEGRFGFRKYGVPQSGAMDQRAAGMANLLLQNNPDAAVLEITLQGPVLRFNAAADIVITGADLSPVLDGERLLNNHVIHVKEGQVLKFGGRISGFRAYLGIRNGFQSQEVLKSRSWCKGVTPHYRLEKGMEIPFLEGDISASERFSAVKADGYLSSEKIEVYPGPEFELLSASEKDRLQKWHFSVGKDSDRMGVRFQEKFPNSLNPIITGPVIPGTMQLTPSGIMIALMRDCQTTGGYPRILQITEEGMNILAQKIPGEKLQVKLINYK